MDAGDVVHVTSDQTSRLFGLQDEVYCTFSGYLLHQPYSGTVIGK